MPAPATSRLLTTFCAALALLLSAGAPGAAAQSTVDVVAEGLATPIGVTLDDEGRVWVVETGSGQDDGRVSVLVDGALDVVIDGLPSAGAAGDFDGAAHLVFAGTDVWVVGGAGPEPAYDLLRYDAAQLAPGAGALSADDAAQQVALGAWMLDQGFAESNVYGALRDDDGTLLISDAAANAIVRFDPATDARSVVATIDQVETGGTPPTADAVPTGLLADGDGLLVGTLTGFPFAVGAASVLRVAADGAVAEMHGGLTTVTDIGRDPRDGRPVALEFAQFATEGGFLPGTGRLVKLLDGGGEEVMADGLNLTTGVAFAADGSAYVTSLFGQLLRITPPPVAAEPVPDASGLELSVGPNPTVGSVVVRYRLPAAATVRLAVYDALGREVARLADGAAGAGEHRVRFGGDRLPSGVYFVRLTAGGTHATRQIVRVD